MTLPKVLVVFVDLCKTAARAAHVFEFFVWYIENFGNDFLLQQTGLFHSGVRTFWTVQ